MTLRRDHLAGAVLVMAGLVVAWASRDLPLGTLASPGPGMLPMIAIGFIELFAIVLVVQAGASPPVASIEWDDLPHAGRVVAIAGAAIAGYTTLGFLPTMMLMLFVALFLVERVRLINAVLFSAGVPIIAYLLFSRLLKSPLPQGILGF